MEKGRSVPIPLYDIDHGSFYLRTSNQARDSTSEIYNVLEPAPYLQMKSDEKFISRILDKLKNKYRIVYRIKKTSEMKKEFCYLSMLIKCSYSIILL